jgi:hypothetical protein
MMKKNLRIIYHRKNNIYHEVKQDYRKIVIKLTNNLKPHHKKSKTNKSKIKIKVAIKDI